MSSAAKRLKRHPLSAVWGPMANDVREDFEEGIRDHVDPDGLRIYILDNMVLDGWWRYNTFLDEGIEPIMIPYTGDDPVGFVLRRNGNRRHQDAGQRVLSIMDAHSWAKARQNGETSEMEQGVAAVDSLGLAEAANVSRQTARQALKAEKGGVGDFVRRGEINVRTASDIVSNHEDILEDLKSGKIDAKKATEEVKSRKPLSRAEKLEAELALAKSEVERQMAKVEELEEEVAFLRKFSEGDSAAEDVERTFTGQQSMIRTMRTLLRRWMVNFDSMAAERDHWRDMAKRSGRGFGSGVAGDTEPPSEWDGSGDKIRTTEYIETVEEFLEGGGPVPNVDVEAVLSAPKAAAPVAVARAAPTASAEANWSGGGGYVKAEAWLYNADFEDHGVVEQLMREEREGADPMQVGDDAPVGSLTWDDPDELALSEIDEEYYYGDDDGGYEDAHDARDVRPYRRGAGVRQIDGRGYGPPNVVGDGGAIV